MSYSSEVLADSPIAYWRLGAGATDMDDSSAGGAHDWTTKTGSPGEVAGLLIGDSDTCRDFGGTSATRYDYSGANLGDFNFTGTASFSIEAWVNLDAIDTSFRRIVGHENATDGWTLGVQSASGFYISRLAASVSKIQPEDTPSATTGNTFHIVGTYNGSILSIYVNGASAGSGMASSDTFTAVANSVRTGPYTGSNYVDGRIDEIAVYGSVLTLTRVQAHYTAGTTSVGGSDISLAWLKS